MKRITADSVTDDQVDEIYERVLFLVGLHSSDDEGACRTCRESSPCGTSDALEEILSQFVRKEESCKA
jgi:hypothetical protein